MECLGPKQAQRITMPIAIKGLVGLYLCTSLERIGLLKDIQKYDLVVYPVLYTGYRGYKAWPLKTRV